MNITKLEKDSCKKLVQNLSVILKIDIRHNETKYHLVMFQVLEVNYYLTEWLI